MVKTIVFGGRVSKLSRPTSARRAASRSMASHSPLAVASRELGQVYNEVAAGVDDNLGKNHRTSSKKKAKG